MDSGVVKAKMVFESIIDTLYHVAYELHLLILAFTRCRHYTLLVGKRKR